MSNTSRTLKNSAHCYSVSVPFPQNVLNSTPFSLVLGHFMRANCRKATDQQDELGRRLAVYLFILSSFQQTLSQFFLCWTLGVNQQSSRS